MRRVLQWFGVLVSEEPLSLDPSVKINFWVGVLMIVSAALFLAFAHTELDPVGLAVTQIGLGFFLASAFPVSRLRPGAASGLLATQGVLICILVLFYVPFMWHATRGLAQVAGAHRSYRVSHAPGILALASGYGLRLAYDFGRAGSRVGLVARRLGWAGIVVGGLADVFVLYLIASRFLRGINSVS